MQYGWTPDRSTRFQLLHHLLLERHLLGLSCVLNFRLPRELHILARAQLPADTPTDRQLGRQFQLQLCCSVESD